MSYNDKKISAVAKELDEKGVAKTYLSYIPTFIIDRSVSFWANLIDNWVLAHLLGVTALSVVSCVTPLYNWIQFSFSLFDGLHIYISNSFGENDKQKVNTVFTLSFYLMLIITAVLTILYLNSYAILRLLDGRSGDIIYVIRLGHQYLHGIIFGLFPMLAMSVFSYMARIDGSKNLPLCANCVTLICNFILDFMLIGKFRYFGAGLATGISYWIGLLILSTHFLKKTSTYKLLSHAEFAKVSFSKIFSLTCPKLAYEAARLCNIFFLTIIGFRGFGIIFGTVNSIYHMAHQFIYIAIFGLADASKPLLGVAYGQKNYKTLREILHAMHLVILPVVGVLCLLFFIFPQCIPLLMNLHIYDVSFVPACTAIRLLTISAMAFAISFIYRIYYQQTGHEKFISVLGLFEPTLFVIPFYYLFAHFENTNGFWWSNILKELISLIVLLSFHIWQSKKIRFTVTNYDTRKIEK